MIARSLAALLLLGLAAGCRGSGFERKAVSRERFVAANVALRMLDSTATQAQRDSVLRRQRVSEQQLRAFVSAHRGDTTLASVWEQIARELDAKLLPADSANSKASTPAAPRKLRIPARPGSPKARGELAPAPNSSHTAPP